MNRLYRFGKTHQLVSNCLTALVGVYYFVQILQKPEKVSNSAEITKNHIALDQDYAESLQAIGFVTYITCIVGSVFSFIVYVKG